MATKYYRLYSDEKGDSHLEIKALAFTSVDFAPPAPPLNVAQLGTAENCFLLQAPAGWEGDWHPAPYRQLHFYLSGEGEVETSDGKIVRIGVGDIVLVEDISGKGHRSRTLGSTNIVVAAVKLAEEDE